MSEAEAAPAVEAPPVRARARSGRSIEGRTAIALASGHDAFLLVERMLASGMRPSVITEKLVKECGLGTARAHAYQAAVRLRWKRGAAMEGSEDRILRYRQMAEHAFVQSAGDGRSQAALLKVLVELEGKGAPPLAADTHEAAAKLVQDAMAQQYGAQAVIDAEGESDG